jgi:hypothetical protein
VQREIYQQQQPEGSHESLLGQGQGDEGKRKMSTGLYRLKI